MASWKPAQAWYVKLVRFGQGLPGTDEGNHFRTYRAESREKALEIAEPAARSGEWDSVMIVQTDVLKRKPKAKKEKKPKPVSAAERTREMFDSDLDMGEE